MDLVTVARGLLLPEGPVWLSTGELIVTEVRRGRIVTIQPDGEVALLVQTGGGPNGAAVGPDGALYVCNNGGSVFYFSHGRTVAGTPNEDISEDYRYTGGRIEKVDLDSGHCEIIATSCAGNTLRAPNDIVFDAAGGFWFTDYGKKRSRTRDRTGVLYAAPIGDPEGNYVLREVLFPVLTPNGIGLSPDGGTLYVAETETGRLRSWAVEDFGVVRLNNVYRSGHEGKLLATLTDGAGFDSLAVDSEGNVAVAVLGGSGGVNVYDDRGVLVEWIDTGDRDTTNICFAGEDLRDAYITCAQTGTVVKTRWPHAGLALTYSR